MIVTLILAFALAVAALLSAVLFAYGMLKPYHPYYVGYGPHQVKLARRLAVCRWVGGLGFVVSFLMLVVLALV